MTPKKKVVDWLNQMLSHEIAAVAQYMDHHVRYKALGYGKLAGESEAEAKDEMKHVERIMERILFLGIPLQYFKHNNPELRKDPEAMIQDDLTLEEKAIEDYNQAAKSCREAGDIGTALLFEDLLKDEEAHSDVLRRHLRLLEAHGKEYLLDLL